MAAKDIYHNACVNALQKDGWQITHDPLTVPYGKTEVLIDLGAESMVGAERDGERIAVEIESFVKPSPIQDLKEALETVRPVHRCPCRFVQRLRPRVIFSGTPRNVRRRVSG